MTNLDSHMEEFSRFIDQAGMDRKDYQYDGVKWCINNELRDEPPFKVRGGFIADEMGLGKTILMLGTLISNPLKSTLIVLPPILIDQSCRVGTSNASIEAEVLHAYETHSHEEPCKR